MDSMLIGTRYHVGADIDNEFMALLATRQKHLDQLILGPMTRTALDQPCHIPGWPTPPSNWPPKLAMLMVPWRVGSKEELEYYTALINLSCHTLRNLTVSTWILGEGIDERAELEHRNDPKGEPLKTLLGPFMDSNSQPKLALAKLNVANQYLKPSTAYLNRCVDFTNLEELVILECAGIDHFIHVVMDTFTSRLAKLYGLNIRCEWRDPPSKVSGLLRIFSGLRYLVLSFWRYCGQESRFDIKCLSNHTSTLQDLYLAARLDSPSV